MLQTKQQYSFLPLFGHGLCDRRAGGFESHEMGPSKNGPLSRTVSKSVVGDEGCPRAADAARFRFGPAALACCAGKRLRVSSAPHPVGFESHALGPNKNGPLARTVSNSVVGDEGCPRAAGAARVPLRRSAPRVLRWKTLARFLSSAPLRVRIPCTGPKQKRSPFEDRFQISGGR